jgi:mono/diheme cytochrome c family protein
MSRKLRALLLLEIPAAAALLLLALSTLAPASERERVTPASDPIVSHAAEMIEEGRRTFRYDTFGDQVFWSRTLGIHTALRSVSPRAALGLGLKVDAQALPPSLVAQLDRVDLDDPAVTAELLRLNAVVGLRGFFNPDGGLRAAGITCALCHSTVDDSVAPGIGKRLDGWANRDLNVGAVINLAPNLQPVAALLGVDEATVRTVVQSWGPGKFDASLFLDGKAFRPDGKTAATLIPPAFGLAGVDGHTFTGWGSVTYWNAFVANLEMHGQGNFWDPRLNDAEKFPVAARNGFGNVRSGRDLITPKLAALQFYQFAIPAPPPPPGSFNAAAAARGKVVFAQAGCVRCHVPPLYTEPGWNRHRPEQIGIDSFQADRSPDGRYRTTPLKGLWSHSKGGFYHDGRFPTLRSVVDHYDTHFDLALDEVRKKDLVEFLKSL